MARSRGLSQLDVLVMGRQGLPQRIGKLEQRVRRLTVRSVNPAQDNGEQVVNERNNLLRNASFENYDNGATVPQLWSATGSAALDSSASKADGATTLLLTTGATVTQALPGNQPVGAVVVSVYARSSDANQQLDITLAHSAGVEAGPLGRLSADGTAEDTNIVPSDGAWYRFFRSFILVGGAPVEVTFAQGGDAGTIALDAAKLELEENATDFIQPTQYASPDWGSSYQLRNLYAGNIVAGTLTVGGSNSSNPVIKVLDSADNESVIIGKNGSARGLFAYGSGGAAAFAVSATNGTSWGGQTLDAGDLLIGAGASYVKWDASAAQLAVAGQVNATSGSLSNLDLNNTLHLKPGSFLYSAELPFDPTSNPLDASGVQRFFVQQDTSGDFIRFFVGRDGVDWSSYLYWHPTLGLSVAATSLTVSGHGVVLDNDSRLTDARVPLAHTQAWSTITSTPTTLAGYGITDAVPSSRALTAGTGIATIGNLSADRTIAIDTAVVPRLGVANTFTENLTVQPTSGQALLTVSSSVSGAAAVLNGIAGSPRDYAFQTGGLNRWLLRATNTAESGSNAGSDFQVLARTDAGGALGTALAITRSTMAATFGGDVAVTGLLTAPSVGFGTSSPSGKVHVKGTADDQQLIVQNNATQTTNPFEVWSSVGATLASISPTGVVSAANINAAFVGGSGTAALLGTAQTFSAAQTFSTAASFVSGFVLGTDNAAPAAVTVRGAQSSGEDVTGGTITYDAGGGTGTGGSGDFVWRTAAGSASDRVAIALDNVTTVNTGVNGALSQTFAHTVGSGSARILIIALAERPSASFTGATSVTYAGLALTQLSNVANGTSSRAELWYLINPPVGTANVVVTVAAAGRWSTGAMSFTGVHQTAPFGTPATATGNSTTASVTVSAATGDLVLDVAAKPDSAELLTGTAAAGQTERWTNSSTNAVTAANAPGGSSTKAGAASVTMSWTWPATARTWSIAAVALKPSSAANTFSEKVRLSKDGSFSLQGTLTANAGIKRALTTKTANATTSASDSVVLVDATSGSITLTLLAAATYGSGRELIVKRIDNTANTVTIDANSAETIDGALTLALTGYGTARLITNGSNWYSI